MIAVQSSPMNIAQWLLGSELSVQKTNGKEDVYM